MGIGLFFDILSPNLVATDNASRLSPPACEVAAGTATKWALTTTGRDTKKAGLSS
jgi:hypothetical protein